MNKLKVTLDSARTVCNFVNTVSQLPCDVDLVSGKYIVDAKSIMGIFSMNLSKPVEAVIHADGEEYREAEKAISCFAATA